MPTEARRVLPGREGGGGGAARPGGVSAKGLEAERHGSLTCSPGTAGSTAACSRSAIGLAGACAAAAPRGGGAGSVCKERGA